MGLADLGIRSRICVADLEEIQWSSLPFNSLSISDEQRDVIMALVEARGGPSDPSEAFDDIIAGKGNGLNILLQYDSISLLYASVPTCERGGPGLGETLTAEAVAEHLKRALYSVSLTLLNLYMPCSSTNRNIARGLCSLQQTELPRSIKPSLAESTLC
jgi:hypothetical protein